MPKRLRTANTYNEPTVMWRLRHPIFGYAHATVIPSLTSATAVWYVNDVPERTHDFCDWSPAIAWLNAVCWELERNGWQLVERRV